MPRAGEQPSHDVPVVTRAAVVGLALVVVIAAFAVPYAVRGGFREDANVDAQAAVKIQAPAGPSVATRAVALGGAAGLPALGASPPGGTTAPPSASAGSAAPPVPVPRARAAPRGVAPPGSAPALRAAPPGGGSGGGGSGAGGFFDYSG